MPEAAVPVAAVPITTAIARLDAWLDTMRQPGGYGGPVAHWWQNRFRYAGPGLDWRYEGLLLGYGTLYRATGSPRWRRKLADAASDLLHGQHEDGSYRASRFEINPGTLGTPHEAAASLGLLSVAPLLEDGDGARAAARRNLDHLIARLWDGRGFNDRPGVAGRVPNKLATLAQALLTLARSDGGADYPRYARAALDDVLRYQLWAGPLAGAVHQYAPGGDDGDGRFFPYYAARCVPPLLLAHRELADERYLEAARLTLAFLRRTMDEDGAWPQVVYANGRTARWPRWLAGTADILLAFELAGEPLPPAALARLLAGQSESGAFRTAEGFASQVSQRAPAGAPDHRDVNPAVGWNDKVLRLLSRLLDGQPVPEAGSGEVRCAVAVGGRRAEFVETPDALAIRADGAWLYRWRKRTPWAEVVAAGVDLR